MKITVNPDGGIVLDIPEGVLSPNTVALVQALRNGKAPAEVVVTKVAKAAKPTPRKRGVSKLTPALAETRDLMARHPDVPITGTEVAATFHLRPATAGWRLRQLVDKGFVYRVGHGRFKLVPKRG